MSFICVIFVQTNENDDLGNIDDDVCNRVMTWAQHASSGFQRQTALASRDRRSHRRWNGTLKIGRWYIRKCTGTGHFRPKTL